MLMAHHHHQAHKLTKKKQKQPFDYIIYFFMVATPLFEIPQIYTIYSQKSAQGVSLLTWGFFFMASFVWLSYALKNKLVPLMVTYSLYIVMEAIIITGIVLYS